ncbi:putative leucine-rich repeat domain superfamily [Dioscorea sansibarensis]
MDCDVEALRVATSSSSSATKLRHLVITNHAPFYIFPDIVKKQTSVRTLIFASKLEITRLPKDLFQKLKLLRILDISGSDCVVLPKSLFKLVHLRHLNLSCLPIKALPIALGNLINLQYLILRYCTSLLYLPHSIIRLQKLRSIDLHQTPLMGMPIGISRLTQLTSLVGFVASNALDYSSQIEILYLGELRTINIVNLGMPFPDRDLLPNHIDLTYPPYLTDLTLSFCGEGPPYKGLTLDNSSFPGTIQHLKINGFFGIEFTHLFKERDLLTTPSYNLKRLDLLKCKYCKQLLPLDMFPFLEHVRIEDAWSITHIDSEFFGTGYIFPKLRSLILQDMPEWAEWTLEPCKINPMMPLLESLEIINCPKLKSLPKDLADHANHLATLTIYKAHSLEKAEGFNSVETATFLCNHNRSGVSGFPTTCKYEIDDCPKLDVTLFPQPSTQTRAENTMRYS